MKRPAVSHKGPFNFRLLDSRFTDYCVLNFASGKSYPMGQARLVDSLRRTGFKGDILAFEDESQFGAPTHQEVPYAFKVSLIRYAQKLGYRFVLWCDSSVVATGSLTEIFSMIDFFGCLFFRNGFLWEWIGDDALKKMNVQRSYLEEKRVVEISASCFGLDLHEMGIQNFLSNWELRARDGSFNGAWNNAHGEVSSDLRVKGHRHDQSIASLLVHQYGLPIQEGNACGYQYYKENGNTKNFEYGGENDEKFIYPRTVLINDGLPYPIA